MAAELDAAVLSTVFSRLPGNSLAVCAQVSRIWRSVAYSETLWQQQCRRLEPHAHLARDDLLPDFGGSHRRYFAWRWPLLRRPVQRIVVEQEQGEDHQGPQIATYPATSFLPGSSEQHNQGERGVCSVVTQPGTWVQQAALSPVGGLLAFSEMSPVAGGQLDCQVVVSDARTGQRVCSIALEVPLPPFYYYWTACGTRLLFLSNWQGGVVALRAVDLAPALLPPVPPGAPQRVPPSEVLLCTARPLFLATSPTSTRLVWHGGTRELGLCDAATATAEDGSEEDCFYANPVPCGSQAPQWIVDANGADWLLMPVMHPQPADGEAGCLVLAPLAGIAQALEAEGSRLSPSLLLSISQQVAPFSSSRDILYAAVPDGAAMVAWCDRGQLHICYRASGAIHQIYPPPHPQPPQQHGQQGSQGQGPEERQQNGGRSGGGGMPGQWLGGTVLAVQWSPDGRRLLFLVRRGGPGPLVTLSKNPRFRWVVYDAPTVPPPLAAPETAAPGWLGTLTFCHAFNPTLEFLDRYLPFFDQYSRSMRLWDPTSRAFCFASRGRPSVPEISDDPNISVQQVPPTSEQPSGSPKAASMVGSSRLASLAMVEAPAPVWLGPGNMASWSWQ